MPTNVITAIARVMTELPGIGRGERSEQGYNYRGIEAITSEAQVLLGRYCVVFVPRIVSREVRELTINGRPWTEDKLEIVYTVYGPGGVGDSIEVGPLIGLGRDNSDKGVNKCMTQAYKYALIQVLCVGDRHDDADKDPAREPDAPPSAPSAEQAERVALSLRIREMTPEYRQVVRDFCDERQIPRVTARMSDDQMLEVEECIDRLVIDDRAPFDTPGEAAQKAAAPPVPAPSPDQPVDPAATTDLPPPDAQRPTEPPTGTDDATSALAPAAAPTGPEPADPAGSVPVLLDGEPAEPGAWRGWAAEASRPEAILWLTRRDLSASGPVSALRQRMVENGSLRGVPA